MSRSVRTFLAIVLFLLAALIAINNIVNQLTSLDNWWLPLLLVIAGLALVLIPEGWSWRGVTRAEEAEADAAVKALQEAAAPTLPATSAEAALAPPAPEAEPAPAPEPEAAAEAEPAPTPEPEAAAEAEPAPAPEPEAAAEAEPAPAPEPEATAEAEPTPMPEPEAAADDLTKIEGIGPKMQAALKAAGITTFARLAQASEDELRAAIEAAGMRFAPSAKTWAEQAAFAARGDWDGLAAFQASLTAGRKE